MGLFNSTQTDLFRKEFQTYLSKIEKYFDLKEYDEALYYLWSGFSILQFIENEQDIEKLFNYAIQLGPFLHYDEDFLFLIENFDTTAFESNTHICSTKHFLKSIILLNKYNLLDAYDEAKLALTICEQSEGVAYTTLCNAQLQVAFISLALQNYLDAENYLKQFNWYIEQCKNDVERNFILTLEFLKKMMENSISTDELSWIVARLKNSKIPFYTTFILMHFKISAKNILTDEHFDVIQKGFQEKKQAIYPIIDEHFKKYHHFKSRFIKSYDLFLSKSKNLFFYNATKNENSVLFTLSVPSHDFSMLKSLIYSTSKLNFIMHEFTKNQFIFLVAQMDYLKVLHALKNHLQQYEVESVIPSIWKEQELEGNIQQLVEQTL